MMNMFEFDALTIEKLFERLETMGVCMWVCVCVCSSKD